MHSGECLPFDRLLIATGSVAAGLRVPGSALKGVLKLDNLFDAQTILQHCRRARTAVVVGGGITALELVEGLLARGLRVHYLLRGDHYWNNVLDETESRIVEKRLADKGVIIHYRTEIAEIEGHKGRVCAICTKAGQQILCDLVAYAIGVQPRKELAQAAGLQVERGILVNEYLQTSQPDIYAAGDVAQVFNPLTGQRLLDALWGTARQQGQAAGMNMSGALARYQKSVPFNVTRLAGLTTTIIGSVGQNSSASPTSISRGESETWQQMPVHVRAETDEECNRLRLLIGEKHLLGAVIMGDQVLSLPLQTIISQQLDITPIRHVLIRTNHLKETVLAFWENWRAEYAFSQS